MGWNQYHTQLQGMKMATKREVKESLYDPSMDEMLKDKLNEEQMKSLEDFKGVVYDNEKYKKYNK